MRRPAWVVAHWLTLVLMLVCASRGETAWVVVFGVLYLAQLLDHIADQFASFLEKRR